MSDEPSGHIEDDYGDPPAPESPPSVMSKRWRPADVSLAVREVGLEHMPIGRAATATASGLHKHGIVLLGFAIDRHTFTLLTDLGVVRFE